MLGSASRSIKDRQSRLQSARMFNKKFQRAGVNHLIMMANDDPKESSQAPFMQN